MNFENSLQFSEKTQVIWNIFKFVTDKMKQTWGYFQIKVNINEPTALVVKNLTF